MIVLTCSAAPLNVQFRPWNSELRLIPNDSNLAARDACDSFMRNGSNENDFLGQQHHSIQRMLEEAVRELDAGTELAQFEAKGYPLTRENFAFHKERLVQTVCHIANTGRPFGAIVCRSDADTSSQIIDPKIVDDAIHARIHPHIVTLVVQRTVNDRSVDAILIPKSSYRPHLMSFGDDRVIVPIRGAANNLTATRFEIDKMYEERFIAIIRQAFPQLIAEQPDAIDKYLETIQFGLEKTGSPELSIVVLPVPLNRHAISDTVLQGHQFAGTIGGLVTGTVNVDFNRFQHWFAGDSHSWRDLEDHFEYYAIDIRGEPLWSVRLYLSGALVYRSPLWPLQFSGDFGLGWFQDLVEATCVFAGRLFSAIKVDANEALVLSALVDAQEGALRVPGMFGATTQLKMKNPTPFLKIPKEPRPIPLATMEHTASALAGSIARILRTYFKQRPEMS